jgi:hypothetical protein
MAEHERGEVDEPGRAQVACDIGARRSVEPIGRQFVGGQPHTDGHCRAGRLAHRRQDLLGEAHPAAIRRVLVRTPVRLRGEELGDQVAVRHRDLDAVDPTLAAVARRRRIAVGQRTQLGRRQRARLAREARRRDSRRRHRRRTGRRRDLLAAAVEQLHEQARVVLVQGVGQAAVARDDVRQESAERVRGQQAGSIDSRRLQEDRPDAAAARRVVGEQIGGRQVVVHRPGLVRGRHPVAQARRPEVDRGQQHRVRPALRTPTRRPDGRASGARRGRRLSRGRSPCPRRCRGGRRSGPA